MGMFTPSFLRGNSPHPKEKTHFTVLVLSYNNERFYEKNLNSLFSQKYSNWSLLYVDDASTDGTYGAVVKKIESSPFQKQCTIIHNSTNKGGEANFYNAIHTIDPTSVVVILDGDDALAHPKVLSRVAREYEKNDAWLTYGSYALDPSKKRGMCSRRLPHHVLKNNSFRKFPHWYTSHLRTFYAKLFQNVKLQDLQHDGEFFRGGWDLIVTFPMLEMAGKDHIRYIPDILYLYNVQNPISDNRIHSDEQGFANRWVRSQKPYKPLKKLFTKDS